MMQKKITVSLDADTAEFLALARAVDNPTALSAFINSLLRQESFRQGYQAWLGPDISSHPMRNNDVEDIMLWRSGLLPPKRKPKRR